MGRPTKRARQIRNALDDAKNKVDKTPADKGNGSKTPSMQQTAQNSSNTSCNTTASKYSLPQSYKQVTHIKIGPPECVRQALEQYLDKKESYCSAFRQRFSYYADHFKTKKRVGLFVAACGGKTKPTLQDLIDADFVNTTDSHGDCLVPGAELPAPGSERNRTSPNRLTYGTSIEMQKSPGSISTPKSASAPAAKHTPGNETKTVPHGKGGGSDVVTKSVVGPTTFVSTVESTDKALALGFKHAKECTGTGQEPPNVVDVRTVRQGGCCSQHVECPMCGKHLSVICSQKAIIYKNHKAHVYPAGTSEEDKVLSKPFAAARCVVMYIIQNLSATKYSDSNTNGSSYNTNTYQKWVKLVHRHVIYMNHNIRQLVWELEVQNMIDKNTMKFVTIIDSKYDQEEPTGRHCIHAVIGYATGLILFSAKASMSQRQNGFNTHPFEHDDELRKIYDSGCKYMDEGGTYMVEQQIV